MQTGRDRHCLLACGQILGALGVLCCPSDLDIFFAGTFHESAQAIGCAVVWTDQHHHYAEPDALDLAILRIV